MSLNPKLEALFHFLSGWCSRYFLLYLDLYTPLHLLHHIRSGFSSEFFYSYVDTVLVEIAFRSYYLYTSVVDEYFERVFDVLPVLTGTLHD